MAEDTAEEVTAPMAAFDVEGARMRSLLRAMLIPAAAVLALGWYMNWPGGGWQWWASYGLWAAFCGSFGWVQHRGVSDRLLTPAWSIIVASYLFLYPMLSHILPGTWMWWAGFMFSCSVVLLAVPEALDVDRRRREASEDRDAGMAALRAQRKERPEEENTESSLEEMENWASRVDEVQTVGAAASPAVAEALRRRREHELADEVSAA